MCVVICPQNGAPSGYLPWGAGSLKFDVADPSFERRHLGGCPSVLGPHPSIFISAEGFAAASFLQPSIPLQMCGGFEDPLSGKLKYNCCTNSVASLESTEITCRGPHWCESPLQVTVAPRALLCWGSEWFSHVLICTTYHPLQAASRAAAAAMYSEKQTYFGGTVIH